MLSFLITCKNCGQSNEFKDGFLKRENEIHVYDSGEFLVSIKCTNCENEVVSDYEE
jgi:ribosomal protein S27E